jgi:hypothetical protein
LLFVSASADRLRYGAITHGLSIDNQQSSLGPLVCRSMTMSSSSSRKTRNYDQIIDSAAAPNINASLRKEGANFTQMYGEEHPSQGNYFWLFSGSNQNVGFKDMVPTEKIRAANLGAALIAKGLSFKGYSEDLPFIGSTVVFVPENVPRNQRNYGRKHVPWISFDNVPNGTHGRDFVEPAFQRLPNRSGPVFRTANSRLCYSQSGQKTGKTAFALYSREPTSSPAIIPKAKASPMSIFCERWKRCTDCPRPGRSSRMPRAPASATTTANNH